MHADSLFIMLLTISQEVNDGFGWQERPAWTWIVIIDRANVKSGTELGRHFMVEYLAALYLLQFIGYQPMVCFQSK